MSEIAIDLSQATTLEHTAIAQARAEAEAYLAKTDWMVIRRAETGKSIPQAILNKRQTASRMIEKHTKLNKQT